MRHELTFLISLKYNGVELPSQPSDDAAPTVPDTPGSPRTSRYNSDNNTR
jgi:hypothetical protein